MDDEIFQYEIIRRMCEELERLFQRFVKITIYLQAIII